MKNGAPLKVLLVSANTVTMPYPVYPLGLDHVAAAISPPHEVQITDLNLLEDTGKLADAIRDFSPDVIGMSLRNVDNTDASFPQSFIEHYRELGRIIRKASSAPLVLGGSAFTIFPKEMMEAVQADYGLIGEGERFRALLDALAKGETAPEIPGLILGNHPAETAVFPPPISRDFDRQFTAGASHLDYYLKNGGMLNLQTRRGCPFRCIYCTYPYIEGKRLRLVPPEKVAETAVELQKAGAKYLFITDSAFNADYDHSTAVAGAFQKAGLSIPWGAFFAPTRPPEGYYRMLADAGLTHVEFGTETLSDRMLSAYGKPFRRKHVFESHEAAKEAKLYIAHYFLPGGPGENADTLDRTLSHIDKLEQTVLFFFCGMRIYPHTPLFDIAVKEKQVSRDQNFLEPVFYRSADISEQEILHRIEQQAGDRPNWIIGAGGEETAMILARMYAKGFSGPLWEYLIR